jgi:tellurite resistance protein TehA-like permease
VEEHELPERPDPFPAATLNNDRPGDMKALASDTTSGAPVAIEPDGALKIATISRRFTEAWIESLPPAYFSLVMATGIVSIASSLLGMGWIARSLFLLNVALYVLLVVLAGLRLFLHPRGVLKDLQNSAVSPGYFTMVAATSVVGCQFVSLSGNLSAGVCLWAFALMLWLLVTYSVFTAIIISARKPPVRRGLNGLWLIAAVATQSISVLGTAIAPAFEAQAETMLFLSLIFYLMGCMLYISIIVLIFQRLAFLPLEPAEMTPPYWISMGATAITTQAGATLLLASSLSPLLTELTPYIKGFTLFFWAAGTWWIPLLLVLGVWTYAVRRVPLTYTPQFWGAVFPMGMYTASTFQLARATGQDFLFAIPKASIYVALLAWTLAFAGLLLQLWRDLRAEEDG